MNSLRAGVKCTNQCVLDRVSVDAKWCQKALEGIHVDSNVMEVGECGECMHGDDGVKGLFYASDA